MTAFSLQGKASGQRQFLIAAIATLVVYAALAVFHAHPYWSRNLLIQELTHWVTVLTLLGAYWMGYRQVKNGFISARAILVPALLFSVVATLIPPFHSADIFGYINRGWEQWHYGLNPYVHPVVDIPNWQQDPMLTRHWINNPSPYGFVFLLIAKLLCAPFSGDKAATVMMFKAFNLLVFWATAVVVWRGIRAINTRHNLRIMPERALFLLIWNPLLLIQALANGHNDLIMAFFITLAAYAAIRGRRIWILPTLVAAVLTKYAALVIVPVALTWLIRQQAWRDLGIGLALGALIFIGTGLPFLGDWQQFQFGNISQNALISHSSAHAMLISAIKNLVKWVIPAWQVHLDAVRAVLKNILLLAYVTFYTWLGMLRIRQERYVLRDFLQDALLVIAVLVCLVSPKFYPWYLAMFFPLAFYLPERHWLRRAVVLISCAQLLSLTFIGQAHMLNYLLMTLLPIGWVWFEHRRQPIQ